MTKFKLEKIEDNRFGGDHPKGINVGHVEIGNNITDLNIGDHFYLDNFGTSTVIEISKEEGIFKTENSTWRLTEYTPADRIEIAPHVHSDIKDTFHLDVDFNSRGRLKGVFEKSEIRAIVEKLDIGIHH